MIGIHLKKKYFSRSEVIAVWTTVIYLLITTTRILSFWKERVSAYEQDLTEGEKPVIIIGAVIACFLCYELLHKRALVIDIFRKNWLIILLFVYAMVSCYWAELPMMALRRFIKTAIIVFCIVNVLSETRNKYLFDRIALNFCSIVTFLSLICIVVLPEYGWMAYHDKVLPHGIMDQKNGLGTFCALTILLVMSMYKNEETNHNKNYLWILAIVNVVLLILTESRTPQGALILSLGFLKLYQLSGSRFNTKILLSLVSFIVVVFCVFHIFFSIRDYYRFFSALLETIGKDTTFTGRYPLWQALFYIGFQNHPVLGSGFGSFFTGQQSAWLLDYMNFDAGTAHNGYLQVFLELGAFGLLLLTALLVVMILMVIRRSIIGSKDIEIIGAILLFTIFFNIFIVSYLRVSFASYIFLWATVKLFYEPVSISATHR